VLLIVTNQYDRSTDALAGLWGRSDTLVMRPSDLSMGGWRYRPGEAGTSRFVAAGSSVQAGDLDGVLTRMAGVFEGDLGHIEPADRTYVAAEMTALLLAWLSELPVPVINRPTATCLCGPLWSQEKWLRVASGLGIPVVPHNRAVGLPDSTSARAEPHEIDLQSVTVVDDVCLGAKNARCEKIARRLADHAQCRLLSVQLRTVGSHPALVGVDVWPNLAGSGVAGALLRAFDRGTGYLGLAARP
jgi:hypothetical protein